MLPCCDDAFTTGPKNIVHTRNICMCTYAKCNDVSKTFKEFLPVIFENHRAFSSVIVKIESRIEIFFQISQVYLFKG